MADSHSVFLDLMRRPTAGLVVPDVTHRHDPAVRHLRRWDGAPTLVMAPAARR
jgi:hypothetical protein